MIRRPPRSTPFPSTTLFRSVTARPRGLCGARGEPMSGRRDLTAGRIVAVWVLGYHVLSADRSRRSEEHTSELQSRPHLVCRLLLEKKNNKLAPTIDKV